MQIAAAKNNREKNVNMSPQIISNVLNQTWFVSTHMKEMARSVAVFEMSKLLNLLNGLQNAAAKFIRKTCHQKNLIFLIYCLVISTHCIKYVHCDIEPQPVNNNFNDDDDDSATNILVCTIICCQMNVQFRNSFIDLIYFSEFTKAFAAH